jgi:hypothetical protein
MGIIMELKEDLHEAKERMKAWWDHEIMDRPVISYYYPKRRGSLGGYLDAIGQDWTLAEHYNEIDNALDDFEKRAEKTFYGAESIPSYFPNYGPGILAAVFGIVPQFKSQTVWFDKPTEPDEIVQVLESVKLNQSNEWYVRLKEITEQAAKRASGKYQVSITDIGGVLDVLSSFLRPENIILTMKRNPGIIDTCRQIILEKLLIIHDELYSIIKSHCDGFNAWLNVWCEKSWYPVQCDFTAMLNPKYFKRFALPDLIEQMEHMDHALYHMDGPNQIPFLEDFLAIESLTGIQWVPGAGRLPQGSEEWMPIYKKIQCAGKNVVIDALPESVPKIYKSLNAKGLYVRAGYSSEQSARFYLPEFVGGENGVMIEKIVDWAKSKEKSSINREDLGIFHHETLIEIPLGVEKELVKEANNSLREKLFFT